LARYQVFSLLVRCCWRDFSSHPSTYQRHG